MAHISWPNNKIQYVQSPAKEHTNLESALATWNLPLVNNFENQWNDIYTQD